jgi:methionine synthase II (cobalamin-independent)
VQAFHEEIRDLARAGCTYLQLDEISFAFLCDPTIRERVRADGLDPDDLTRKYARVVNEIAAGAPPSMTVAVHTCRGNFQSMWMAEGSYDRVASIVFDQPDVDAYFLEYDSDRSGGFEPLKHIPKTRPWCSGSSARRSLRSNPRTAIKRRIDEAAKFFPLERLCLRRNAALPARITATRSPRTSRSGNWRCWSTSRTTSGVLQRKPQGTGEPCGFLLNHINVGILTPQAAAQAAYGTFAGIWIASPI